MIDKLLNIVAPHLCCGCGKIGSLLCGNCKYDITSESYSSCINCQRPTGENAICTQCNVPYKQAWCVGERMDTLQRLIGVYKFSNARAAHKPLAQLLDETLPVLPTNTVIIPIPTVASHIRERGYDHILLVARALARRRRLKASTCLQRITRAKQRDARRSVRIKQARHAFRCSRTLDPNVPYLLIDDVVTTGATIRFAAQVLRDAGARHIWVAAIARQPLD